MGGGLANESECLCVCQCACADGCTADNSREHNQFAFSLSLRAVAGS